MELPPPLVTALLGLLGLGVSGLVVSTIRNERDIAVMKKAESQPHPDIQAAKSDIAVLKADIVYIKQSLARLEEAVGKITEYLRSM